MSKPDYVALLDELYANVESTLDSFYDRRNHEIYLVLKSKLQEV